MSTKSTLSHSSEYHLFQECFEKDNVYLNLDGGDWSATLDTSGWVMGNSHPQLHLKIDVKLWRRIVEGWVNSQWGQNPSEDYAKIDFDLDQANAWLDNLHKKEEEK